MQFKRIPSMTNAPFCVEPVDRKNEVHGRSSVRLEALPCSIKAYPFSGKHAHSTVFLHPFREEHLDHKNFLWPQVFVLGSVKVDPRIKEYDLGLILGEKGYYRFMNHHHPIDLQLDQVLDYGLYIRAPTYWGIQVYTCDHNGPIEVLLNGLFLREIC
jgi:hypothetical protein